LFDRLSIMSVASWRNDYNSAESDDVPKIMDTWKTKLPQKESVKISWIVKKVYENLLKTNGLLISM